MKRKDILQKLSRIMEAKTKKELKESCDEFITVDEEDLVRVKPRNASEILVFLTAGLKLEGIGLGFYAMD
jgi:hypothetical protein